VNNLTFQRPDLCFGDLSSALASEILPEEKAIMEKRTKKNPEKSEFLRVCNLQGSRGIPGQVCKEAEERKAPLL